MNARERLYLFDTTLRDGAQTTGRRLLARGQARHRGACSTGSASTTSRAAIPGANPLDTEFFAEKRTTRRQVHRLRHDQARRALGLERSRHRGAPRRAGRRDLLRRQGLGLPCRASRSRPRLEENLDGHPRERRGRPRARAARCWSIASTSSTATRPIRDYALACATRRPTRPARAGSCSATPTAARCRTRSRRSSARSPRSCRASGLGIHAHDDCGCAVANSLAAVEAGARQIQGTLNGLGERCGNANLVTLIGALKLKDGYADRFDLGVSDEALARAHARVAAGRRDPQPPAEPPCALRRRERLRDQGRHPRLRGAEGPAHLRACRARDRRQRAQGAGLRPGRPVERAGRAEARRHRARQGRPARRAACSRRSSARRRRAIAFEGADASFYVLVKRHPRRGAGLLRRRALLGQRRAPLQRGRRARHRRRRRS